MRPNNADEERLENPSISDNVMLLEYSGLIGVKPSKCQIRSYRKKYRVKLN